MSITLQQIEQSLLSASGKACLTDNQFECIQDALSGMNMGECAYYFWHKNWLDKAEQFGLTDDDVEYMLTVKFIVNFVNKENML